jgi:6-phosphogluconolactonase
MSIKPEIKIFKTADQLAETVAAGLKDLINAGTCHIALSGGSTPAMLFQKLATEKTNTIHWRNAHFYWGDERCVGPNHDESNFKMTKQLLFDHINIPIENIQRIQGELEPENEAKRYAELISENVPNKNGIPQFDLILLGMGTDGHTASIFPNQMNLLNSGKLCDVATHPDSGQKRITFTGSLINHAKNVVFLVTGSNKAEKIDVILCHKEGFKKFPAAHIAPNQGLLSWYLDQSAASLL